MIDLITGHQGVAHISADQIASINNAMMDNYGANKVMRLVGGELTANGLTIEVGTGYWRANGFDMEVQEAETIYIDPTAAGLSRIDNIYVEILQDIPTGAQRSEIVTVNGEPSATPTAPEAPTAPELNTDILLQVVPLASVTVTEGAMVMTDLTIAYEMVTPSELEAVETIATDAQEAAGNAQTTANTASTNATNALNMIRSTSSDVYSSSKAYSVGDHVIYNNKVYKCITACSAGSWSTNQSCFSQTTLTSAVTDLNSALPKLLWENSEASGTGNLSEFSSQKVSLDTTQYDIFMIETCRIDRNMCQCHIVFKSTLSSGTSILCLSRGINQDGYLTANYCRELTFQSNGITFTSAYVGHAGGNTTSEGFAQNNSYLIPIRIYGIKL